MNSDIFEVLGYVQVTRFLSRDTIEAQRLIDASVRLENAAQANVEANRGN